jgi:hypothetical protein
MSAIEQKKRGPEAERVKIEGMDWGSAVRKALQTPPPARRKRVKKSKRK